MRHSRHYVDELLGDAPLRTVREIPIAEIETPADESVDLDALETSIRRLGVIEPLLVGKGAEQYRVIAGMRRLRAAHKLGLGTVPCLVHEVDEQKLLDMREAAKQRVIPPPPAPSEVEGPSSPEVPDPPVDLDVAIDVPPLAASEAAQGLEFVSALLPAMNAAGSDRLRWAVLTDLAGVELLRAKTLASATEILARSNGMERALVDCGRLVSDVVSSVATEARLRTVRMDVIVPDGDAGVSLDAGLCRSALTGLLQCLLALAPRTGTTLTVHAQVTMVRPALIVHAELKEGDPELGSEAVKRFFDPEWREHPCGIAGAQMLAALAKTARAHGGRVELVPRGAKRYVVTFVVPRPLTDF